MDGYAPALQLLPDDLADRIRATAQEVPQMSMETLHMFGARDPRKPRLEQNVPVVRKLRFPFDPFPPLFRQQLAANLDDLPM